MKTRAETVAEVACTLAVAWFTIQFYRASTARVRGLDDDFLTRQAAHKKMIMFRRLAHWAGAQAIEAERKYWELSYD